MCCDSYSVIQKMLFGKCKFSIYFATMSRVQLFVNKTIYLIGKCTECIVLLLIFFSIFLLFEVGIVNANPTSNDEQIYLFMKNKLYCFLMN